MTKRPPLQETSQRYHHGDLREALLRAGEAELEEKGIEAFSLRGVAKRAGVSHAAPAHHFTDATGLLTALATRGFARFIRTMQDRRARAEADGLAPMTANGFGYIEFALAQPALFSLMFSSSRPDFTAPELSGLAARAFDHLVADVRASLTARGTPTEEAVHREALSCWGLVHGLAHLLIAGRVRVLEHLSEDERAAMLRAILDRQTRALTPDSPDPA